MINFNLGQLFPLNDNQIENKFFNPSIGSWTIIYIISSHNFAFEVQSLKLLYLANDFDYYAITYFQKMIKIFQNCIPCANPIHQF